jgi:hypothetical protein
MPTMMLRIAGLLRISRPARAPPVQEAGVLVPFNRALEDRAARRFVHRRPGETDKSVADRWALAVCELIEETANEHAELEQELEQALAFARGATPCDF